MEAGRLRSSSIRKSIAATCGSRDHEGPSLRSPSARHQNIPAIRIAAPGSHRRVTPAPPASARRGPPPPPGPSRRRQWAARPACGRPGCSCRRPAPAAMPADRAGDDAADGDHGAFAENARQEMPRRRADRQPDAELARPRAHRERQHAGHADHGDRQRDGREAAEHQRVQPIGREHFGAHVFERRRLLHRLLGRQLANDPGDRRHQRIGIGLGVDEERGRRRSPARTGDTPSAPAPAPRSHRRRRRRRRRCGAARC